MAAYIFLVIGFAFLAVFCVFRDKKSSVTAVCFKTVVSVMFIATAVAGLVYNQHREAVLVPALLMIGGLVLGLVGDVTLDLKIYLKGLPYDNAEKDSDKMTYIGMASFGVGHILYIIATGLRFGFGLNLLYTAICAVGVTGAIFIFSIFIMKMKFGKFLAPSISYCLLLTWFVAYSAWQLAMAFSVASVLLLVGAVMFIVSDLILSMTYFSKEEDYKREGMLNPESRLMIITNHVTYYIAQFLIAIAVMFI
ncbi:MAG: lysoplasmalogenase [Clostridia bacterium]|nr:lysoplasmalogenase [Clostridia bacterium]